MYTAWKVSKNGVFSGPSFPAFWLNIEIYSVNFCIQSEYDADQKKLRIETLFTQWYKDVKETIKQYFLVRMEEACGDELSLETILSLKKILKESWLLQMVTYGRC